MTENNRFNGISSGECFYRLKIVSAFDKLNFLFQRRNDIDEAPHGKKSSDFQLHAESDLKSINFYYIYQR